MTVEPEQNRTIDRRAVFDFAQHRFVVVCPFSEGQPITFLEPSCAPEAVRDLGKYTVDYFDVNDFFVEAMKCSPLMGIHGRNYKPESPVVSYLLLSKPENFDPENIQSFDNRFDRKLRQFLNDIGAPVAYYNASGVFSDKLLSSFICLSFPIGEKFSLVDELHEFGFSLPETVSIETSTSNCSDWVKERLKVSLSEPVFGK